MLDSFDILLQEVQQRDESGAPSLQAIVTLAKATAQALSTQTQRSLREGRFNVELQGSRCTLTVLCVCKKRARRCDSGLVQTKKSPNLETSYASCINKVQIQNVGAPPYFRPMTEVDLSSPPGILKRPHKRTLHSSVEASGAASFVLEALRAHLAAVRISYSGALLSFGS